MFKSDNKIRKQQHGLSVPVHVHEPEHEHSSIVYFVNAVYVVNYMYAAYTYMGFVRKKRY